jgi:hypothetical protein
MSRIENSFLAQFLLLIWDGFRIIATEFLGLTTRQAAIMADLSWIGLMLFLSVWLYVSAVCLL